MRCSTFLSTEPHTGRLIRNPGAFIVQIAAMKTAFARGRIANVNANAVRGHIIMLTQSGHPKLVSAYNVDGTTKWPTKIIVSHAGPSSA